MKLLQLPIPILVVALQAADHPEPVGPAWYGGVVATLFLIAYILNVLGKFPGASNERRTASYTDEDRSRDNASASAVAAVLKAIGDLAKQVEEMHKTVTREDVDKPGWPMVWNSSKESREMRAALMDLARLVGDWVEHDRSTLELRIQRLEDARRQGDRARATGTEGA